MTKEDYVDELFMRVQQVKENIVDFIESNEIENHGGCEHFAHFLEVASRELRNIASAMKNLEN